MVQIQDWLPKGELKKCQDIWGNSSLILQRSHLIWKARIRAYVVDVCNILGCYIPCSVWGSCSVQQNVDLAFQVPDSIRFHWVLLWMIWFSILVLDHELPVYLSDIFTFLFHCIVSSQG